MDLIVIIGGQVCIVALFFLIKYRITDMVAPSVTTKIVPSKYIPKPPKTEEQKEQDLVRMVRRRSIINRATTIV